MTVTVNINGTTAAMNQETFQKLMNMMSCDNAPLGSAIEWNILKTKKRSVLQGYKVQMEDSKPKKQHTYPVQRESKRAIYR